MSLDELYRIRLWHLAHRREHPVESHLWDGVLTLWILGWMGWLPAFATGEAIWFAPLGLLAMRLPDAYRSWRSRAHQSHRLRCDWLDD
ncbi:hypothetical protein ACT80S_08280 [Ramlibacter sp. MAHUQ-53]|uniref:hypothetical protein n=1 Tax=unclassified Ramlibacter TaxID=2617605 RepID=UPI00362FC187